MRFGKPAGLSLQFLFEMRQSFGATALKSLHVRDPHFFSLLIDASSLFVDLSRAKITQADGFFDDVFVFLIEGFGSVLKIGFDSLLVLLKPQIGFFVAGIVESPGFGEIGGDGPGRGGS